MCQVHLYILSHRYIIFVYFDKGWRGKNIIWLKYFSILRLYTILIQSQWVFLRAFIQQNTGWKRKGNVPNEYTKYFMNFINCQLGRFLWHMKLLTKLQMFAIFPTSLFNIRAQVVEQESVCSLICHPVRKYVEKGPVFAVYIFQRHSCVTKNIF